jgi:hypothetical protein
MAASIELWGFIMRKYLLAAIAAMTVLSLIPANAEPSFSVTGTVLVGDPVSRRYGAVTETVSPCNGSIDPDVPAGAAQGVDGYWIQLPEGSAGATATLVANTPGADFDAWFYTEGCSLLTGAANYTMATTDPMPNGDEEGTIPEDAAWVAVDLYIGAAAEFTFSIL